MNITRSERETLNNLSLLVFGRTSVWQKLPKVVDQIKDPSKKTKAYVQMNNGKGGKPGTVLTYDKAKELGYDGESTVPNKIVMRERTLQEIHDYLTDLSYGIIFQEMDSEAQKHVLAYNLFHKLDLYLPMVHFTKTDRPEYDVDVKQALETIPEFFRKDAESLIADNKEKNDAFSVNCDVLDFLLCLSFCANYTDESAIMFDNAIENATAKALRKKK